MNFKIGVKYVSCVVILFTIFSCGSSNNDKDSVVASDSLTTITAEKDTSAQKVFAAIPTPLETADLLKKSGAKYNLNYLNSVDNVSKYSTAKSKALNLGVYGADLSFISMFDQTQESLLYLSCTNKLATGLGITNAFNDATSERIEANMGNKDSLLAIISESYNNAQSYLASNGQKGVSALMVAGGWIEGLSIALQVASATNNQAIMNKIADQKTPLNNMIALLEINKADYPGINEYLPNIKELQKIYESIPLSTDKIVAALSKEQFKRIADKTSEIRKKLIQ
jgi:hypothetical protein